MVNGKVSKTCISAHIPTSSGNFPDTKSTIIVWDWAGIEGQFCILCSPHQYYYNFPVYQIPTELLVQSHGSVLCTLRRICLYMMDFQLGIGDCITAWNMATIPNRNHWGWWLLDTVFWPFLAAGSIGRKLAGYSPSGIAFDQHPLMTSKEVADWLTSLLKRKHRYTKLVVIDKK